MPSTRNLPVTICTIIIIIIREEKNFVMAHQLLTQKNNYIQIMYSGTGT